MAAAAAFIICSSGGGTTKASRGGGTEEAKFKAGNGGSTPGEAVGKKDAREIHCFKSPVFFFDDQEEQKTSWERLREITLRCEAVRSCELPGLVYHVLLLKMHNAVVLTMENKARPSIRRCRPSRKYIYIGETTKQ